MGTYGPDVCGGRPEIYSKQECLKRTAPFSEAKSDRNVSKISQPSIAHLQRFTQ